MSNSAFQKDLYRYYGTTKETLKQKLFRPLELQFIYAFRKAKTHNPIVKLYYRLQLYRLSKKRISKYPTKPI